MVEERLMVSVVLLGLLALLPLGLRVLAPLSRRRAARAVHGVSLAPDRPTVLYFWSHDCHQCRVAQAPALDRLAQETAVHIVPVDAVAERGLADRFGVLTVPTTIVIDPTGGVRAVNHGFAPLPKLRAQTTSDTKA